MNGLKRAETLAWASLGALLTVALILLAGGLRDLFTAYWAGMMLALGQAIAVGLAAWGLMLARQSSELGDPSLPRVTETPASTFRMSMGDDLPAAKTDTPGDVRTLDTGFQRLLVGLSGVVLVGLGALTSWLVYRVYQWSALNPDQKVPVAGTYEAPKLGLDELGLVIGLGAAGIYGVFWWLTRVRRDTEGYAEAVSSGFTLGIGGMVALAGAALLGFFRVSGASELAAGIIAALMMLQGLELLVNCMRSYSNVEEFDQEAVDLQALPLVPMLGSVWLSGLKMLFAQSVGLSAKDQREAGVFARMMPRALAAMAIIAIGVSCIRVVQPGEVAILERLGYAPIDETTNRLKPEAILGPGMHLTLPWPIDELVSVPTDNLQLTDVGAELHAPKEWKNVDFQFWTIRATATDEEEEENQFLTGDPGRQMLETYVQVRWRVKDPALFYMALSHSEFYEKKAENTRVVPIYEAIIQHCTTYAVTRTFAIHSFEDILIKARGEAENHCKRILQEKLDSIGSGIDIVNCTIKDLHPPYWRAEREDPTAPEIAGTRRSRGPAGAFEFVINARQYWEMQTRMAEAEKNARIVQAKGVADATIATAQADRQKRISQALSEVGQMRAMLESLPPESRNFDIGLMMQDMRYKAMLERINPANGAGPPFYIVDPTVDFNAWQTWENTGVVRPPNQ